MKAAQRIASLPCGRWTKWLVLAFWLALLVVSWPLAGKLTGAQQNDSAAWLPANAESTEVLELQRAFQPDETFPAVVVYERRDGITEADRAAAAADATAFAAVDGVNEQVTGPVPAKDGQALETLVPITVGDGGWAKLGTAVKGLRESLGDGPSGLNVHITGPAGVAADSSEAFEGIDGTLLYAALSVVIIMLLLTYRSPVLWLLPVISAASALFAAQAAVYLLAKHGGLTVNAQSAGILTVLVFGAGTDYALLLVARYREELRRHTDRHEAMAYALHRAGPAIIASASTVGVGMLCLLAAEMNSTSGLGPVAAVGIGVALLAMITLLPALLVIVGRWIFWPVKPRFGTPEPTETGRWARIGQGIDRHPRVVWIATATVLGVMALGLVSLNAGVLSNKDSFLGRPDSIVGEEVLARHFAAGSGQPVVVIAKAPAAEQVRTAFASVDGIDTVTPPVVRGGSAYLQGTLADAPDGDAAKATVDRVRDAVHGIDGADAKVGGGTAIILDAERAASGDNKLIIPLVLLVVFVILALLAACAGGTAGPHGHRGAVVRGCARHQRARLQERLRLRRGRRVVPAVRLRVPRRAGHRLQHLPDDPGAGGGREIRPAPWCDRRACRDGWGHHVGGSGPRRHVRGAGHAASRVHRGARVRGGVRRPAGHDRRARRAGDRPQPRPRPADVVAKQARPPRLRSGGDPAGAGARRLTPTPGR